MSGKEDRNLQDFQEKEESQKEGTANDTRQLFERGRSVVGGFGFEKTGGEFIMDLFHSSKLYKKAAGAALKGWFEMSVVAVIPYPPLIMVGLINPNYYFTVAPSKYSVTVVGASITVSLFAQFWCFLEDGMETDSPE